VALRKQIIRRVEDAIAKDAPEEEAERLHAEILEQMEGAEFEEELGTRPVQEIVIAVTAGGNGDSGVAARAAYPWSVTRLVWVGWGEQASWTAYAAAPRGSPGQARR
jgi:hypothetical protein